MGTALMVEGVMVAKNDEALLGEPMSTWSQ
jgi:hypothetical protein